MWLVKKNVFVVICQARSHGTSSSSTRMRMSSGMASVGWVCKHGQHTLLSNMLRDPVTREEMGRNIRRLAGSQRLRNEMVSTLRMVRCDSALTVGELGNRFVHVLEAAHDIRQTGRRPEVLLLETELLANYECRLALITRLKAHTYRLCGHWGTERR